MAIIAMTAHALAGEDEKCYRAGMNGYISKPFEPENLYSKILNILNMNLQPENSADGMHTGKDTLHGISTTKHSDLTYLRELARGSDSFIKQMLTIFIEQTPEAIEKMEKAVKEKDWKALRFVVHKMKPSIMFAGLNEIRDDIPLLEEYALDEADSHRDHLDEIPHLVEKTKKVCLAAIEELKEEVKKLG